MTRTILATSHSPTVATCQVTTNIEEALRLVDGCFLKHHCSSWMIAGGVSPETEPRTDCIRGDNVFLALRNHAVVSAVNVQSHRLCFSSKPRNKEYEQYDKQ